MSNVEYDLLYERVNAFIKLYRQERIKSPTIAELADLVGDTEEKVLECLEFGNPVFQAPHYLH
ncbi:hypothetical protein [Halalkalibacterium ligniniphilum]|uniref:hypothetical protein n=1 Tax=Halalkalibacterium ligniniphilum TaxID=1134413 RepID=UPI00034B06A3|nr:hypothetical protein [Halalkalibacterium ligniniphilum]